MIYNASWKRREFIEGPTQEQILDAPEFFALSLEEVLAHPKTPEWMKLILLQFPWDGRHSVLQIRPQDWTTGVPDALGGSLHTDVLVRLNDGTVRVAKSVTEFHLMVCSWGGVVGTEFISTPMEMRDMFDGQSPEFTPMQLLQKASSIPYETFTSKEGELVTYTSSDIHRVGSNPKVGRLRLIIVAFNCDQVPSGGLVLPSIRERRLGLGPKFSDYVR